MLYSFWPDIEDSRYSNGELNEIRQGENREMRVKVLAVVRIDICKKDKIGQRKSLDISSNFLTISWEGIMLSLIEAIHEAGNKSNCEFWKNLKFDWLIVNPSQDLFGQTPQSVSFWSDWRNLTRPYFYVMN
jgi:hypothetical protein